MASDYPHLPNAPIVEALIDFRVRLPDGFDIEILRALHGEIEEDFPRVETQKLIEGRFHFSEEGVVTEGEKPAIRGFRMLSENGTDIVQFRRDGFTFSRLHPYTRWQTFFDHGWNLWKLYAGAADPGGVTRLATRFINRLKCPLEFDLEEYFRAPPEVPDGVPDALASFLYRYVLAPVDDVVANVTLTTERATAGQGFTSIVFDIDCYVGKGLGADEDLAIRATFAKLREMKNRIFFRSLTPTALEAFE